MERSGVFSTHSCRDDRCQKHTNKPRSVSCSAFAAYLYFRRYPNVDVKYIPARVEVSFSFKENESLFPKDCVVFLYAFSSRSITAKFNFSLFFSFCRCDFVGSKNLLLDLSKQCSKVIVLDHHKTSLEMIQQLISDNSLPSNGRFVFEKCFETTC